MTRLVNRNIISVSGRSSMRLEPEFWDAAREICMREDITLADLVMSIENKGLNEASRTSALRTHILSYYRGAATESGHRAMGHGDVQKVVA